MTQFSLDIDSQELSELIAKKQPEGELLATYTPVEGDWVMGKEHQTSYVFGRIHGGELVESGTGKRYELSEFCGFIRC